MTVSGDLIIDSLTPGSSSDSNIIEVGVSTNASHGYYLSATVGSSSTNTSLTHSENNNYKFTSLSSNVSSLSNFSDNQWGYSYSTDGGANWVSGSQGSTSSGYNGLPLDNDDSGATGITLVNTTNPVANNSIKFKIGAKASNTQPSGTYTNTINFYAITNQTPISFNDAFASAGKEKLLGFYKMQDMNASICNAVEQEIAGTLIDVRDNQTYRVAKLKDGKCWMVENLNLAGGTKLSSDTTDFESTYSLPTNQGWKNDGSLPDSSESGFDNVNYAYVYNSGNTTNCGTSGQNTPCYSYYSWDAATLGSGRTIAVENTDAEQSICPKGWRLPTSGSSSNEGWKRGDFYALAKAYGANLESADYDNSSATGANFYNNAGPGTTPNFLLAGFYSNSSFNSGGSLGYYWSATSGSTSADARYLVFSSGGVWSANIYHRRLGFAVRCILKAEQ